MNESSQSFHSDRTSTVAIPTAKPEGGRRGVRGDAVAIAKASRGSGYETPSGQYEGGTRKRHLRERVVPGRDRPRRPASRRLGSLAASPGSASTHGRRMLKTSHVPPLRHRLHASLVGGSHSNDIPVRSHYERGSTRILLTLGPEHRSLLRCDGRRGGCDGLSRFPCRWLLAVRRRRGRTRRRPLRLTGV